jgi:hypothetical protein
MVEKNVRAVLGLAYILKSGTFDGVRSRIGREDRNG